MLERISIVGTGLIGCSIALGAKGMSKWITGFDINQKNLDYAIRNGIVDQELPLERIISDSDVIIVSVPVDKVLAIVPVILDSINGRTVVVDVGSTKSLICELIQHHPRRGNFVAAHPMAGSEIGGPQNASADLLHGRKVVICQHELSSPFALTCAMNLFINLGVSIEYMDADAHDSTVALVSHLPQIVSYCMASTVADSNSEMWANIAASGFDSSTRLAKSPSEVWVPILAQNKKHVCDGIEQLIRHLEDVRYLIISEDYKGIKSFIECSQKARELFEIHKFLNVLSKEEYNYIE